MTLKVFDLQCEHGHLFEGWFRSHDDYEAQQTRGLLNCPMCSFGIISKRLSAPHLNIARHTEAPRPARSDHQSAVPASSDAALAGLQAAVLRHVRQLVKNTENVGARFAEEARRIHEGEADKRPIRGMATAQESQALVDEGIDVLSVPDFLDDTSLQ
jgi:hypothetical protein